MLDKEKPRTVNKDWKGSLPQKRTQQFFVQQQEDGLKTNMQETLYEFSQVYLGIFMYIHVYIHEIIISKKEM